MPEIDGRSFPDQASADRYISARDMLASVEASAPSEQREHMLRDCERAMAFAVRGTTANYIP